MAHKKRKVWLTSEQVDTMLTQAKHDSERDYLLLLLMRYGLRCGEIVGWRGLPGIRIEDIRDDGVWVKGKGYAKDKGLDAFTIRDLMRHKNITTTNLYVGQSSTERLSRIMEELASG